MTRLAHISDVHITASRLGMRLHDWWTKRPASWLNLRLFGRGRAFRYADQVLDVWRDEIVARGVNRVIFSGDATAMGFPSELERAADLLGATRGLQGIAVPGNHDYGTRKAAASGDFERYFEAWLDGQRLEDHTYPFAQKIGDVWFVGLNSAKGNVWFWDASGRVGETQLERLRKLLADLPAGPRIIVTHYPLFLANGKPEHRAHGLRDAAAVIKVASEGGVKLWLHGHRHGFYWFENLPGVPFAMVCAGSGTQSGLWSYLEYDLEGTKLQGRRRVYDADKNAFQEADGFSIRLD